MSKVRRSLTAATAAAMIVAAPTAWAKPDAQAVEGGAGQDPAKPSKVYERLLALADEWHEAQLRQWGWVKDDGDVWRAGRAMPDVGPARQAERLNEARRFAAALETIRPDALTAEQRIDRAVLATLIAQNIGDLEAREWEMPFNSDSNFWSYLAEDAPLSDVAAYETYIARMRDLPRYFGQHIANMRAGLARGFSVPAVTLVGRDASIAAYAGDDVAANPFYAPFAAMPPRIAADEQARLKSQGADAITNGVIPAYRRLLAFMREEYVLQTRRTIAASAMPGGGAYYAQQIREYTTLDLGPEEIHRQGLAEVARIAAEMDRIKAEVGFAGTLPAFIAALRTDPQFVAASPDALMGIASYTAKRVDGQLGRYFGFLPRHRFTIREVDPAIAPFYTAGRGGLEACQINTHDLPSRPVYNIPALTLHECAPGHSFQAAIARERDGAPQFRRNTYFSGFGEGWGLYVEWLGTEMGIYRTPYERFGQLSYEMWRAARLVIDTGIHHYGWSRERAIAYLADRTALSQREVETEVDRYISWPGQALAYKLGEMTMRRVRAKAEAQLGDRFDVRKFHDVVLALGSVPLPVLEERIDAFIADGGKGLPGIRYD